MDGWMKHKAATAVMVMGALAAALAAPAIAQQQWGYSSKYPRIDSVPSGSFAQRLLDRHNEERRRVGVPPLAWDAQLAADAQDWAEEIARQQFRRRKAPFPARDLSRCLHHRTMARCRALHAADLARHPESRLRGRAGRRAGLAGLPVLAGGQYDGAEGAVI